MERSARPVGEDWTDDGFVQEWLTRQEARADERSRQYAMVRALVPRVPDDAFAYLNLAAGDGALDELLLARFPRARATLVDMSPVMIESARRRLSPFAERVSFHQVDLEGPGWTEQLGGPFDLAVSTIALHNLEDPLRLRVLYAEIFRILADGGGFFNLDYVRAPSQALWPLYRQASADPEGGFAMGIRGMRDYAGTLDEQLGWLREAGFSPVDCFWREFRLAIFGGFRNLAP
jgi:tRNA (cmo5U34)-methyltransferase